MKKMTRFIMLVVGLLIFLSGVFGTKVLQKIGVVDAVKRDAAIQTVNGGNAELIKYNAVSEVSKSDKIDLISIFLIAVGGILMVLGVPVDRKCPLKPVAPCFLVLLLMAAGCRKPYDAEEYVDVSNNQTAYLVPLEGDVGKQVRFDSVSLIEKHKIALKRIPITHRWQQMARRSWQGKWIPDVKAILVDRSPVNVEWEAIEPWKNKNNIKDNAIWTESSDSIGFSLGWTVTAYIEETNTSTFLYWYPNGSLKTVLDTEVKARIQKVASLISAKKPIDILRNEKVEIATAVEADVIPFFATRGITISTIGMYGGMVYDNEEIQKAIDGTFIAQQEKVVAKAILDAQEDKNKKIESEAGAKAKAAEMEAQGIANGNLLKAKAEAEGIEAINNAIAKTQSNMALIELKRLEIEKLKYEKWGGKYPDTVVGEGSQTWIGLGEKKSVIPVAQK